MICDRYDVVLVPFPFVDIPVSKKRPALVISSRAFNSNNGHTIFAMITSAKSSTWPSDHLLLEHETAGLVKNCYIRWKTFTLPNEIIMRSIGQLSELDRHAADMHIERIFLQEQPNP
jgi:mRNA interferase MazF